MAGRLVIAFLRDELPENVFDMDLTPHDTQNVADAFRGVKGMIIGGEILGTIAHAIRNISELHWHKEAPIPIDRTKEEEDGFVYDLTGDPAPGEPGSIENPLPPEALAATQPEPQEEPNGETPKKTRRKKRKDADPL